MNILLIMIPVTILIVLFFVASFYWATYSGQFDDLITPAHAIFVEDEEKLITENNNNNGEDINGNNNAEI